MPVRTRRRKRATPKQLTLRRVRSNKYSGQRHYGLLLGRAFVVGCAVSAVAAFVLYYLIYRMSWPWSSHLGKNALDRPGMLRSSIVIANGSFVSLDPAMHVYFENKLIEAPQHAYTTIALMNMMFDFSLIVQSMLCQAVVTRSQLSLFLQEDFPGIYISSPGRVGQDFSVYSLQDNIIQLSYHDLATPGMIVNALRNEMFYAQSYMRYKEKGCVPNAANQSSLFVCGGKNDREVKDAIVNIVASADNRIRKYVKCYNRHAVQGRRIGENSILARYTSALLSYANYHDNIAVVLKEEFNASLHNFYSAGDSGVAKVTTENTRKRYSLFSPLEKKIAAVSENNLGYVSLRYSYCDPGGNNHRAARAFVAEWIDRHHQKSVESSYLDLNKKFDHAVSLLGFIDSLPSRIKSQFFVEFCDFFSRYFEVVNYCDHDDYNGNCFL